MWFPLNVQTGKGRGAPKGGNPFEKKKGCPDTEKKGKHDFQSSSKA